jgi:hypothetical protein
MRLIFVKRAEIQLRQNACMLESPPTIAHPVILNNCELVNLH